MKSKHTWSFTNSSIFVLCLLLILLDQLTKYWARNNGVVVLPGLFKIYFKQNFGAVFGILQGYNWLFVLLTVALILLLLYYHKEFGKIGLGLVLAGSFGNLIDRIFFGYVTDFIGVWVWPTFNLADAYNVVGVIIIVWQLARK